MDTPPLEAEIQNTDTVPYIHPVYGINKNRGKRHMLPSRLDNGPYTVPYTRPLLYCHHIQSRDGPLPPQSSRAPPRASIGSRRPRNQSDHLSCGGPLRTVRLRPWSLRGGDLSPPPTFDVRTCHVRRRRTGGQGQVKGSGGAPVDSEPARRRRSIPYGSVLKQMRQRIPRGDPEGHESLIEVQ